MDELRKLPKIWPMRNAAFRVITGASMLILSCSSPPSSVDSPFPGTRKPPRLSGGPGATSIPGGTAASGSKVSANYFAGMKGCFLLYNLNAREFEESVGEDNCQERLVASSTFKIPLAVMAFDAELLTDEKEVLKWDGRKYADLEWNKDQDPRSWMTHSVAWVSQRLTQKLGEKRLQKYLHSFRYGNEDLRGGILDGWLKSPTVKFEVLKISAYEQVEFMKALWTSDLPVSERSMKLTRKITYLERSPRGVLLNGKTGSNYYDKGHRVRLGWFVTHVERDDQEYIAVTLFSDLGPTADRETGGERAKEITKEILADRGLW